MMQSLTLENSGGITHSTELLQGARATNQDQTKTKLHNLHVTLFITSVKLCPLNTRLPDPFSFMMQGMTKVEHPS